MPVGYIYIYNVPVYFTIDVSKYEKRRKRIIQSLGRLQDWGCVGDTWRINFVVSIGMPTKDFIPTDERIMKNVYAGYPDATEAVIIHDDAFIVEVPVDALDLKGE